jgi:leucyl-tRNA synthetase
VRREENAPAAPDYAFEHIERAWQARWDDAHIFWTERTAGRPKWFVMELPPFANGDLHLGHARNYAIADAGARFRRMAGYDVSYTSGFDTFGLPNETAARTAGEHLLDLAERYCAIMAEQFVRFGLSHDRRRIIGYHIPEYYVWIQWVFLKLHAAGHLLRRGATVNWCPRCDISLAESLIDDGVCWRCKATPVPRETEQWFIRESDFADDMLAGLPALDGWPSAIKGIHRDWIGRREGLDVDFGLPGGETLSVFSDDPALLADAAFIALGHAHPLALAHGVNVSDHPDAHGVPLNVQAEVPLTGRTIPLVVVCGDPATPPDGARLGVPLRDRFARELADALGLAYAAQAAPGARDGIAAALLAAGAARAAVRYRLRDWNIARQRYWGPPVPMIHCAACGLVPVPAADLPVVLPLDVDLDGPGNPLERHPAFTDVACPSCGGAARRDTDTLEAYSSPWWYHWLCKSTDALYPFSREDERAWLPVDVMVGGMDQARSCFFHVRMIAKALLRLGIAEVEEPVTTLVAIGMVKSDGRKMSKSDGKNATLAALMERYGADAVRLGILGAAAPESDFNWSEDLVRRAHDTLAQVHAFVSARAELVRAQPPGEIATEGSARRRKLAGWVDTARARVTNNYVRHQYHLAAQNTAFLFERLVQFEREAGASATSADDAALASAIRTLLQLVAPLTPHLAEELWERCGGEGFIALAAWPQPLDERARRPRGAPAEAQYAVR